MSSLVYQWIQELPSVYNTDTDAPKPAIGVDLDGNFYVAYVCVNPVSAGQTNVGLVDICVAKLTPLGQALWYRQQPSFDTPDDDLEPCLCVDPNGNVYVTYYTTGMVSGQVTTVTHYDIVVFKLNTYGDTLWVKQSPTFNTGGNDTHPTIATDGSGNVYIAYTANDPSTPDIYYDNIVAFKLDTNGNLLWIKNTETFNTPGGNYNPSICVDDSGHCIVAYYSDGTPPSGETNMNNSYDIVVFKLDEIGNLMWIRQRPSFDTTENNFSPAITVDTYGAVYVSYHTTGTVSGQTYTGGMFDIVVFKMDTNGNVIWVKENSSFNTDTLDYATSIGIDPMGTIYVAYSTSGVTSGQTLTGTQDIVVIQMDNDGNILNLLQQSTFNTTFDNVYPSIAVDVNGNCAIAYYSVNPGLGSESGFGETISQQLIVFKLRNLVCVVGDTQILMSDGSTKAIQHIQRGDIVAPNHQVARLCYEPIDYRSNISLVIFEKNSLGNRPDQRLIVTPNHPIFYKNARRPAKCFGKCPGVLLIENIPITHVNEMFSAENSCSCLYDLQFDHEGSYLANGVEIQSRSPNSYHGPLPKELYYDPSLYCTDKVWDCLDHLLPLDITSLTFTLIMLKNKRHEKTNRIVFKHKNEQTDVSIIKYGGQSPP